MRTLLILFIIQFQHLVTLAQTAEHELPGWQAGYLDIHHINTGRGNATFCIFPDGTTLLIDAGDMSEAHPRILSPRNCNKITKNSESVPQYIVEYIQSVYPVLINKGIDYALITHYHDDHFGEADNTRKLSSHGYLLTGITEVGTLVKINLLIDRGFEKPVNLFSEDFRKRYLHDDYHLVQTLDEYKKFIDFHKQRGLIHQPFIVGSNKQVIMLNEPDKHSDFMVQNLFGLGRIWHGWGESCFQALPEGIYPGENPLSLGLKITYGKFDYYTGGDISGIDHLGMPDDMSMEAQAAPVVGQVDVATLNHHGNRDSQSPVWVRTLRPKVWVQQSWSSDHPGHEVLNRIASKKLYPDERDLYALCMTDATRKYIGEAIDRHYTSASGHVLIRVYETGEYYEVYVIDDLNTEIPVKFSKKYQSK